VPEYISCAHGVEVFRDRGRDERCRLTSKLGAKQAEKVRLGYQNDAVHALRQSTFFEELGEVVRELPGGALVPRIPPIRRVAPLSVAVEIPLWTRFEVVVFDATSSVLDGPEKFEISSPMLEQPSARAMSDKNPG
jgi:hypothetical protein